MLDLRPFKRQNNLPVSYPLASYDSLVRRLQKEKGKDDSEPAFERKGFTLSQDPDDPDDPAEKALQHLLQREFTRQQQKAAGQGEVVEASVIEVEVREEAVVEKTPVIPVPDIPPEESAGEEPPREESSRTEQLSPVHLTVEKIEETDEISALFEEAERSFNGGAGERELSFYRIAGAGETERTELLFNLSQDSLLHPEKDFRFLLDPSITMNSGMELVQLQKANEHVVFHAPSAPLPPLRSRQRQVAKHVSRPAPVRQTMLRKKVPLRRASVGERLVAFLIDGSCMVLLGLAVAIALCLLTAEDTDRFIVELLAFQPLNLVQVLGMSIPAAGIMTVLFPLLSLVAAGTTPGLAALGLIIETEDAEEPPASSYLIRSCCFPLTFLAVGPLPVFPGERFLHDYLAGVLVGRRN